jgi:hypothetical protein
MTEQHEQPQGCFAPSSARCEGDKSPVAAKDLMVLMTEVLAQT